MMMSEGAGELNSTVGAAAAVLPRSTSVGARTAVPIILSATELEATGARMQVGGLRVVDRRHSAALTTARRPRRHRLRRQRAGPSPSAAQHGAARDRRGRDAPAIEQLRAELGPEVMVVGADNVWLQPARFDRGTRVVDAASRRAAAETVFRRRPAGDGRDRRSPAEPEDRLAPHPALAGSSACRARAADADRRLRRASTARSWSRSGSSTQRPHRLRRSWRASPILDGCAGELARVRLHQTAFGAWLDTVVGDFVNVVMILAVGFALWRHGGTLPRHEDGAGCRGDDAVLRRGVVPRADAPG